MKFAVGSRRSAPLALPPRDTLPRRTAIDHAVGGVVAGFASRAPTGEDDVVGHTWREGNGRSPPSMLACGS